MRFRRWWRNNWRSLLGVLAIAIGIGLAVLTGLRTATAGDNAPSQTEVVLLLAATTTAQLFGASTLAGSRRVDPATARAAARRLIDAGWAVRDLLQRLQDAAERDDVSAAEILRVTEPALHGLARQLASSVGDWQDTDEGAVTEVVHAFNADSKAQAPEARDERR